MIYLIESLYWLQIKQRYYIKSVNELQPDIYIDIE